MSFFTEDLHKRISQSVAHHERDLTEICKKIHENPEYNYKEFKAHDNICNLMQQLGYNVKRHSFQVESGKGGKLIVFNAEYDALPGLGHACGHNLIATSSIAAFLATAEVIRESNIPGRVRLLGTPAEEGGGGKVHLIKAGAYEGVDACLMAHPTGRLSPPDSDNVDGVSAAKTSARKATQGIVYRTKCPCWEIHGVIRSGGSEPNIIPDSTDLEYYLRAAGVDEIKNISKKVKACFEAGAIATGCDVKCTCDSDQDYMELRPNMSMSTEFTKHMKAFGRDFIDDANQPPMGASTDM
ncbi:unnamed protein product, partial [Fusarium langsethiae]